MNWDEQGENLPLETFTCFSSSGYKPTELQVSHDTHQYLSVISYWAVHVKWPLCIIITHFLQIKEQLITFQDTKLRLIAQTGSP